MVHCMHVEKVVVFDCYCLRNWSLVLDTKDLVRFLFGEKAEVRRCAIATNL